jgi:hypothetical protein
MGPTTGGPVATVVVGQSRTVHVLSSFVPVNTKVMTDPSYKELGVTSDITAPDGSGLRLDVQLPVAA